MDRRKFLKTAGLAGFGASMLCGAKFSLAGEKLADGAPNAEKLGWHLGCQSWSFNKFTLYEAIDKTASVGLHYIEIFPGHKLSKTVPAGFGPGLKPAQRTELKKKLSDSGVKVINTGVGGCDRGLFEFCKEMGIETIVSEPDQKTFDAIDKLVEEYKINVALHNHPKPSRYWNPDIELAAFKGHSPLIGACCDTGHWPRSGLKPIECLKKLEGHIKSFHFKDLNKIGPGAHDVPWGTGAGQVKEMMVEILRQKFKGVFSIEYEYNWTNSLPEIAQSVKYFNKIAGELANA